MHSESSAPHIGPYFSAAKANVPKRALAKLSEDRSRATENDCFNSSMSDSSNCNPGSPGTPAGAACPFVQFSLWNFCRPGTAETSPHFGQAPLFPSFKDSFEGALLSIGAGVGFCAFAVFVFNGGLPRFLCLPIRLILFFLS